MRHSAWLDARIKKAAGDKSDTPELTRREHLAKDGIETPVMPPCSAQYVLGYLFEIGPTAAVGMGEGPITHSEIAAWMGNTGIRLSPWEARMLRRLSVDYLRESSRATQRGHPAPWQSKAIDVDKLVASSNTKDAIRNLLKL